MIVSMKEMLAACASAPRAVAAFNVYGFEDAAPVLEAAEGLGAPVILMTNRDAAAHMPLEVSAALYRQMAEKARVPVCIHLDHAVEEQAVYRAIAAGYTSVMFDGSQLPLEENIRRTRAVTEAAAPHGVSVEAEIGAVGYADPSVSGKAALTEPGEAALFQRETGVDALAVAVGTLHRMTTATAEIDFDRLMAIEKVTSVPLVIHGSSGIRPEIFSKLTATRVSKINLGTTLRMTFGESLREEMARKPEVFDRIRLFRAPMEAVKEEAIHRFRQLGW